MSIHQYTAAGGVLPITLRSRMYRHPVAITAMATEHDLEHTLEELHLPGRHAYAQTVQP